MPLTFFLLAMAVQDPLANPGFVHFYNLEYDQALAASTKKPRRIRRRRMRRTTSHKRLFFARCSAPARSRATW